MQILLTKGDRSDKIEARRDDGSIASESVPHKGPIAHDLVHYAVERELGFARGFWGLVEEGNAPDAIAEMAKAAGHASVKRAQQPDPHFIEAIQAERIVEAFEAESWSQGDDNDSLRAMAEAGCSQSLVICPNLSDEALNRARALLNRLAGQWTALAVGESLALDWSGKDRAAA